jgi:hypothetical protein
MKNIFSALIILFFLSACSSSPDQAKNKNSSGDKSATDSNSLKAVADIATILSKKEVPVLCYHHIRNFTAGGRLMGYEVTPTAFAEQMKALADSGYKTILLMTCMNI